MSVSGQSEMLAALCQKFQVSILYVFGSRAVEVRDWLMGESTDLASGPSDVDVGVRVTRRFSVKDKIEIALALEDLFQVGRVDLIVLNDADPFLAANIIRGERVYANDTYAADEYDLYVLRRAGDLAPLERERMALILGAKR